LPRAGGFWIDPLLLAFGPELGVPPCPDFASMVVFEGHADLTAPAAVCGACSCEPPTGACELPPTVTASAASCAQDDTTTPHTPFDPAPGWTGACDFSGAIPAGKLCDGGVDCVQSVTIAPLTVKESGCAPVTQPVPENYPSNWATFARACEWAARGECATVGDLCSPVAAGFRACVATPADVDCPANSPYTEKHVFYGGIDDTRGCTPCTCGAPAGSSCAGSISIFSDAACSALLLLDNAITSLAPSCHDLPTSPALGSKSAGPTTYTPGTCAPSGGEPLGTATPSGPVTFCCLP